MDPVTLIVTALSAGIASALQDDAKAAYGRLRDRVRKLFHGHQAAELVLAEHQADPKTWEAPLTAKLTELGAANDAALVDSARALLELIDQIGSRAGKYRVTIKDSKGVQVGDHNVQVNTFGAD